MTRRQLAGLAAAALALVAAAFLAVLAVDVLRWQGHLERADARLAAGVRSTSVREPDGWLTGIARDALALDDDVAYRHGVQRFLAAGAGAAPRSSDELAKRAEADSVLARIVRTDPSPERRSLAATLRGALLMGELLLDDAHGTLLLRRSAAEFRRAARLQPANEDAAYDLELVLRLLARIDQGGGSGGTGQRGDVEASGAGAASSGSGY